MRQTRTIEDFKANRYDKTSGVLVYTDSQVNAFEQSRTYYAAFFGEPTTKFGAQTRRHSRSQRNSPAGCFF